MPAQMLGATGHGLESTFYADGNDRNIQFFRQNGEGLLEGLHLAIMRTGSFRENDQVLAIWMLCIALYSIFNNLMLSVSENAGLLAIWYALGLLKWNRMQWILVC